MENALADFLATGVLAFILTFVRMGTAIMIMPGVGDSFVNTRIRLLMALGISFVLFPIVTPYMPSPVPSTISLFSLITMEFIIGLFFGTIARIFMMALDTAGMVISIQSGLGNAQIFNPALSTQGSIIGAFLSVFGVLILFATNMHHLLFMGLIESYELFPVGAIPDTGSMAELMSRAVSQSFLIGVKIAVPFIMMTLMIYVGMGVLSRLMPQVQVFLLAIPVQILLALGALMLVLGAAATYWLTYFEQAMVYFLTVK